MEIFREREMLTGKIDFGGILKRACLEHVPEVQIGDYVLVHVGYALTRLDEAEAKRVFACIEGMDELREGEVPE